MNNSLDETDRRILSVLQQRGDISNRALADAVGLSPPPCLKRVRRLQDVGVIEKTVALLNPDLVGQGLIAFVDVELEKQRDDLLRLFEQRVSERHEVLQCYMVSGDSDYLLVINVLDMKAYELFVRDVFTREPNILKYKTRFGMSRVKYSTELQIMNNGQP
ncbi:Lrp/AsnC family transcriptional regulator [Pseudovibrio sp. Tun.PSC04-5.I4]|uniref:Lrp/AsnC family transcriptional regulator n=1 Tax=Pseudovibrio sp. Tun.PSC04-5.I4 TaxID=1798213 RepID=UPI000889DDEC|nr:Lrp/AsnC family transcriptional regulator [Pseudovibrio sp. Tun.PSC04-5.I4]SDR35190.1 transcriptional regulator, AsnC family [Pseudovibrio sp. Tun.PSC04-5.I4]